MKILACVIAGLLVLAILLVAAAPCAVFYNGHIHPLGRLWGSVSLGDPYDAIEKRLVAYHSRRERAGAELSQYTTEKDLHYFRDVPRSKVLSLVDSSPFDDVQLSVRFDETDRVCEIMFVGD